MERVWQLASLAAERFALGTQMPEHPDPASLPIDQAIFRLRTGDVSKALRLAKEVLRESGRSQNPSQLRSALAVQAEALIIQGALSRAEQALEAFELLAMTPEDASRSQELRGYWHMRSARWGSWHLHEADRMLASAAAQYSDRGEVEAVIRCQTGSGWARWSAGEYGHSLEVVGEALHRALSTGSSHYVHRLALLVTIIAKDYGYEEFALRTMPVALSWCEARYDYLALARGWIAYANLLSHRPSRAGAAVPVLMQTIVQTSELGLYGHELEARSALVHLYRVMGDPSRAEAEMHRLKERADGDLEQRYTIHLWQNEQERATLYERKLERQIRRLTGTLEATRDAILIFEPRVDADGEIVDFACDTWNEASIRLLHPDGHGIHLLSDFEGRPQMAGIAELLKECERTGLEIQGVISANIQGQERYYHRSLMPLAPGVAVCLRDVSDRVHWDRQVEEVMLRTAEETLLLELQTQDLIEANQRLDRLAITDGLTEVYNHRAFQDRLDVALRKRIELACDLSCFILDIDHFKRINDQFGHLEGDQVLRRVASLVQCTVGNAITVARYGGEEFAAILPGYSTQAALDIANRVRAIIEQQPWVGYQVTVSIGVATISGEDWAKESMIALADEALYVAKRLGRNRVVHANEIARLDNSQNAA